MQKMSTWLWGLLVVLVIQGGAYGGTLTPHGFLYKPDMGARGVEEKNAYDAGLDRLDARLGKEIWVGDPQYGTTFHDAVTQIGSTVATLRVPAGTHSIPTDLVVPGTLALKVENGAVLAVADGKTLTINGPLEAGPYQIFSGSGSAVIGDLNAIRYGAWSGGSGITINGLMVDGSEITGLTAAQVGLGNVTNDAQLKAAQLDTDPTLAANSDEKIPSQKAVKAYADAITAGATAWGSLVGNLADQTDLNNALGLKLDAAALAAWPGSPQITTLGTVSSGVWHGTPIGPGYGGTGNAYTQFTGPTTTVKTFTLPNASKTLLATDGDGSALTGLTKSQVGLGNVDNIALSTWLGSANLTTLGTINAGVWNATAIGPTKGGTGQTSITTGDLLFGSASNVWSKLPGVATGNALLAGGVGAAPLWGKIGLTTHVTGILAAANGGTGSGFTAFTGPSTATKTFTLPNASCAILTDNTAVTASQGGTGQTSYAVGDLLYASGSTTLSKLAAGATAGQVLTANGAGTAPSWQAVTGGGDVTGPDSSVASEIALFDGASGKLLKSATLTGLLKANSGVLTAAVAGTDYLTPTGNGAGLTGLTKAQVGLGNVIDTAQLPASYLETDPTLATNSDTKVPSQKAVKAYADAIAMGEVCWSGISGKPTVTVGDSGYANLTYCLDNVTSGTIEVPSGCALADRTLAANKTLAAGVTLKVMPGAPIHLNTGVTLTINGPVEAGPYQWIEWAGTGKVVFGNKVAKVFPEWWGATGDNTTDDGTAINAAATAARNSSCKRIAFISNTGYAASIQLDLQELNVENARIESTYAGPAVLIGDGRNLSVDLIVDRPVTDWTATHDGIHILGENNQTIGCYFDLGVSHSAIGIKVQAPVAAISICYNTFHLRNLLQNDVDIYVHHPAGAAGVCNENLVLNGNFGNTTAGKDCCIKILSEAANPVEKWTFVKPNFEDVAGTGYACIFEKTRYTFVQDARFGPGAASKAALFNADCVDVVVTLAYGSGIIRYDIEESAWMINVDVRRSIDHVLHRLNDVSTFNAAYHDGTYWHVPGFAIINMDTGVVERKSNSTNYSLIDGHGGSALYANSGYQAVALRVDFYDNMNIDYTYGKKLYIKYRMLDDSYGGGVRVKCYDAAGNCLSGNSPAYVQGANWTASGTYYSIVGSHALCALVFHEDVAYAYVGPYKKDNAFTGFEIYSPYQTDCYVPYTGVKEYPGKLYAANAPTKWHFQVGETVLNDAPASGQPQGWVCTKCINTTLTADVSGGASTITVASIAGIASGDIIGIKRNSGPYHFTTVNGTPSGSTITLTAAMPSSGVQASSGNPVVANLWKPMANLP